jgi:biotin carboxylase
VIVLVNPLSSGYQLSEACQEAGVDTLHLYEPVLDAARAADTVSPLVEVHESFRTSMAALRPRRPIAVLAGSNWGVRLADELGSALGLPHNDPASVDARVDKAAMVKTVAAAGIGVPATFAVSTREGLDQALDELGGGPVVLKWTNSGASRGCLRREDRAGAVQAFGQLIGRPNGIGVVNDVVLVQRYEAGPQFGVNTVSMAGRHLVSDVYHQRYDWTSGAPTSRDLLRAKDLTPRLNRVVDYALSCLDALGVVEGCAHTEVRWSARGPVLVEVNSRHLGCVHTDPYFAATGTSQVHLLAERHLDPDRFARRLSAPYSADRALGMAYLRSRTAGSLVGSPGLAAVRRLPGFHGLVTPPRRGQPVTTSNLAMMELGGVYFVHDDEAVVRESLDALYLLQRSEGVFRTSADR